MKFRKKPVVIEAVQFTGDNQDEIVRFAGLTAVVMGRTHELHIKTTEGMMHVSKGDWVIRGVKGEMYPCKPDIFQATYQPVDESGNALGWGQ
jgi:UDP-2,3-diacylglucosamine pyrophosphatase LpxH